VIAIGDAARDSNDRPIADEIVQQARIVRRP
jgi:hypothetical protein